MNQFLSLENLDPFVEKYDRIEVFGLDLIKYVSSKKPNLPFIWYMIYEYGCFCAFPLPKGDSILICRDLKVKEEKTIIVRELIMPTFEEIEFGFINGYPKEWTMGGFQNRKNFIGI